MSYWCQNIDEALDLLRAEGYDYEVGRNQWRQVADVFIFCGGEEVHVQLKAENSAQASFERLMALVRSTDVPNHWMAL